MMELKPYRFDPYLQKAPSADLKLMARLWGDPGDLRKTACLAMIREGLADPERVRRVVSDLAPFAKAALALLRRLGNQVDTDAFGLALLACGADLLEGAPAPCDAPSPMLRELVRSGLLLSNHPDDPTSLDTSSWRTFVFSDERMLEHADPDAMPPLHLAPVGRPQTTLWRPPQAPALDLRGVLSALDAMDGLSLTQHRKIRAADERKLERAMGWGEHVTDVDGLPFPEPFSAFLHALLWGGLLEERSQRLVLRHPPTETTRLPHTSQTGLLLETFLFASRWSEFVWDDHVLSDGLFRCYGRVALVAALAAIPVQEHAFLSSQSLSDELFARLGEHFAVYETPERPDLSQVAKQDEARIMDEWRATLRESWAANERTWLQRALSTWLYALGMVELGFDEGELVSFRLTQLGREILHPHLASVSAAPTEGVSEAWVVQPNFDVVVYLDRATPAQLAFIERHAERVDAGQHAAQYRLTRNSVYEGLESGTSGDELVVTLQAGSQAELPQNVLVDLGEWAAAREQVVVHRNARLLEFSMPETRQGALDSGIGGALIGERLLMLEQPDDEAVTLVRIDYAEPLPECLSVTEDGLVELGTDWPDLLIRGHLDRWAERVGDGTWRLTAKSVSSAAKAGLRIDRVLDLLSERLTHEVPPMLEVALRAWAGGQLAVQLGSVTVLRCPQPEVYEAITTSPKCKPWILEALGPDALVVDAKHLRDLKAHLRWAGLQPPGRKKSAGEARG